VEVGLFAALLIVVYLIVLNGFLNELFKARIDWVLSALVLGLVALIFALFGWKSGLPSIAFCFIAVGLVKAHPVVPGSSTSRAGG